MGNSDSREHSQLRVFILPGYLLLGLVAIVTSPTMVLAVALGIQAIALLVIAVNSNGKKRR